MSDFSPTEMDYDVTDIEANSGLGQSVTFSSKGRTLQTVVASIGDLSHMHKGTDEGLLNEDAFLIVVRAAALAWIPQDGDTVVVDGSTYRVRQPRHVSGDICWTFECEGDNI